MNGFSVSGGTPNGVTMVSNFFIDDIMKDLNDAQMKIYLTILRNAGASVPGGICGLADRFNLTEGDVLRSLNVLRDKGLLSLHYDEKGSVVGLNLNQPVPTAELGASKVLPVSVSAQAPVPASVSAPAGGEPGTLYDATERFRIGKTAVPTFNADAFTADRKMVWGQKESSSQLLFIAEQYLGRTLSENDLSSLIYITDVLHFSDELTDYLIQYCAGQGKKSFHYINAVAASWAEEGITTVEQAAGRPPRYEKSVYTVLRALGRNGNPTKAEAEFVKRWSEEWGFSQELILEACRRTVLGTDKHRLEFADKILSNWKDAGIRTTEEAAAADEAFRRKQSSGRNTTAPNAFHRFRKDENDNDDDGGLLDLIKIN